MEIQPSGYGDAVITVIKAKPRSADVINRDQRDPAALFRGEITYYTKNNNNLEVSLAALPKLLPAWRAFLGFFPSCTIKTDPVHRVHRAVRPDSVLRVPVRPRSALPGKRRAVVAIIRAPVGVLTGTLSGVLTA